MDLLEVLRVIGVVSLVHRYQTFVKVVLTLNLLRNTTFESSDENRSPNDKKEERKDSSETEDSRYPGNSLSFSLR